MMTVSASFLSEFLLRSLGLLLPQEPDVLPPHLGTVLALNPRAHHRLGLARVGVEDDARVAKRGGKEGRGREEEGLAACGVRRERESAHFE